MTWNDLLLALWPAIIGVLLLAFAGYLAWEDRPPPPKAGE
jgi:hypothetical protein